MRPLKDLRGAANVVGGVAQVLSDGTVVGGRYVLEARIGDGGMGTVYRARHAKVSRQFAIKILHHSLMAEPKVLRRFEREAELAGRLRHTNVASVVDVGLTDNGLCYMAMELAPGVSLADILADGALSEARTLDLVKQLCAGLQHAHEVGLIHRDFKPENVIVEQQRGGREVARIVDFGLAILREEAGDDETDRLTTKGMVVGTPHYMAPEQARAGILDHRVDIFALGLLCYEMLTGKLPFEGTGAEVARANLVETPPPMAERAPDVHVDPVLEAIVMKMLEKDPSDRPPSANAVRELLELYERDRDTVARLFGVELARRTRSTSDHDDLIARVPNETIAIRPQSKITTDKIARRRSWSRPALVAAILAAMLVAVLMLRDRAQPAAPSFDARSEAGAAIPDERIRREEAPREPELLPQPEPRRPIVVDIPHARSPQTAQQHPPVDMPTAADVAKLYATVGRELKALEAAKGMDATIELWPRYRWIRVNEAIATPENRMAATTQLDRLLLRIRELR